MLSNWKQDCQENDEFCHMLGSACERAWDCEPSLLVPSDHLETIGKIKAFKGLDINALG